MAGLPESKAERREAPAFDARVNESLPVGGGRPKFRSLTPPEDVDFARIKKAALGGKSNRHLEFIVEDGSLTVNPLTKQYGLGFRCLAGPEGGRALRKNDGSVTSYILYRSAK